MSFANGLKALLRKTRLVNKFYHAANTLYTPFNALHPFNLIALTQGFQRAKEENLEGDYYEFGVYTGFSLWFAYQLGREYFLDQGKKMHFWGFDSFDGFLFPTRGNSR